MAATELKKRKWEAIDSSASRKESKLPKKTFASSLSSSDERYNENSESFNPVNLAESGSDLSAESDPDMASQADSELDIGIPNASSAKPAQPTSKKRRPTPLPSTAESASDASTDSDDASDASSSASSTYGPSTSDHNKPAKKSKRSDPTAFATSISSILNSKLTSSKRPEPILALNRNAQDASRTLAKEKLEAQARRKVKAEKKLAMEKGRVRDVLTGTDDPSACPTITSKDTTGVAEAEANPAEEKDQEEERERVKEMQELEKRLRKTAQRGVVKLFNAVRQAQVRAEEAAKEQQAGTAARKAEKVEEMSKKGFLEMVASGGASGGLRGKVIEEA